MTQFQLNCFVPVVLVHIHLFFVPVVLVHIHLFFVPVVECPNSAESLMTDVMNMNHPNSSELPMV
jgi:hypothetical protein